MDQTHLSLQEYDLVQLNSWAESKKKNLFKLQEQKVLPYETDDNVWISVTVEMNLNRMDYSRGRYTAFDLLSDVGGFYIMIATIFALLMAVWNYNSVDNFMVTKLFRVKPEDNNEVLGGKSYQCSSESMTQSRWPYWKEYLISCFSCFSCCNC